MNTPIKKLDANNFYLFLEQSANETLSAFHIIRMFVFILTLLFIIIFIISMHLGINKLLKPINTLSQHLKSMKNREPINYHPLNVLKALKNPQGTAL